MTTTVPRCAVCLAPLTVREDRTRFAHLSWCRWAPRAKKEKLL